MLNERVNDLTWKLQNVVERSKRGCKWKHMDEKASIANNDIPTNNTQWLLTSFLTK